MDFQTSIKTCLTQKYASFQGRAARSEYWWFLLAYVLGALVVGVLGMGILSLLYVLAMIVPLLAAGWRRLQDTGRPGWYILVPAGVSLLSGLLAPPMQLGAPMMDGALQNGTGMGADMGAGAGSMMLFALLGLVQLGLLILYLYWLTRPSQPGTNDYGPPPAS